jgi:hypothetical protein
MNTENTPYRINDISIHCSAIIAGIGLLIMAILAPIANFSILQGLIIPDDAAKTFSNIAASEGLFRLGIFFFLLVVILDIIVAWALYIFLSPVNRSLSLLAAWLRIVYATLLAVGLYNLINVLHLLSGTDYLSVLDTDQLQAQVMLSLNAYTHGWQFGLIIFGFHLLLLGYLAFKAGYMKKILGILIIVAALGYMIDGCGKLLSSHYSVTISLYTFIGEVVLIFWLLIKGRKIHHNQQG